MHFTSWVFPKGHRIRLAVNNAQWPMLWPTPEPMTTELKLGDSRLTLPVVPYEQRPVPDYLPPAEACTSWRVMLESLENLEQDMHRHIHKENSILFPRAIELESKLR